jgi:hypothetical protein
MIRSSLFIVSATTSLAGSLFVVRCLFYNCLGVGMGFANSTKFFLAYSISFRKNVGMGKMGYGVKDCKIKRGSMRWSRGF